MSKNRYLVFLSLTSLASLMLLIYVLIHLNNNSDIKVMYVDNIRLFNEFNMSKDLKSKNDTKVKDQKMKLDSLYAVYAIIREKGSQAKKKELETKLRNEDMKLKEINDHLSSQVSTQVWERLNIYLKEYAENNNHKIVLGALGNGNIMYAMNDMDLTDSILEYANARYVDQK